MTSRLLTSLLLGTAAVAHAQVVVSSVVESFQWSDPFGSYTTPPGFEAACEAASTFRATQHVVQDINEAQPVGLAPWADAIPYFFGGRPYPGTWDGVDPKGPAREVMMMEYADVPTAVKDWIAEQQKDKEGDGRYLFAIYDKPKKEGDKVSATAKLSAPGEDGKSSDDDRVMMFAAGAIYSTLPLWVAKGSDCQADLLDLSKYKASPVDKGVVAWPIERSTPNLAEKQTSIEFKIKAQVLRETEEGRVARLAREKEAAEEEERRKQEEEEARLKEEAEASAESQKASEATVEEKQAEATPSTEKDEL